MKVSIVGAGNVGSTTALFIANSGLADIVIVDILSDLAKAKAMDISHALSALDSDVTIQAADDYKEISGSDIVVITAGLARKPGMSREDLLKTNSDIVGQIVLKVKESAPDSIIVMVTNPLDSMAYMALGLSGFDAKKVIGMAGVLDSSRFTQILSENLNVKRSEIESTVLGSHGDLMVPLLSKTKAGGRELRDILKPEQIEDILEKTKKCGGQIVSLLKSGSAYYGPAASCFKMCKAILNDTKEIMCASVYLDGEYGLNDVCIGVPVRLGKKGVEEIIEVELSKDELADLQGAAQALKENNKCMKQTE